MNGMETTVGTWSIAPRPVRSATGAALIFGLAGHVGRVGIARLQNRASRGSNDGDG